jgi:acetylornithine/N-succinyldiaminopimelate aminotransferase
MMTASETIQVEDNFTPPFFKKIPVSIERGSGVHVWDEAGNRHIDFTSGWGVTCLGHAHPVITDALLEQSRKIIQNPNSGLTYSPARARLLSLMRQILPAPLTRIFFSNSGAEANDAAIKLARKATARMDVIAMNQGFHGRTISTASATGQNKHREKFNPLMPNYRFIPYDDLDALGGALDNTVAAVILEPVQGEGGVMIVDEIQTGFCRTGPMFAISHLNIEPDFMTMAKGIAGGFPFGAFAMSEAVAMRLEPGDHGGTYCGNPLGCSVAYAVIKYLIDHQISAHVMKTGEYALARMHQLMRSYPGKIIDVRGRGMLLAMEFCSVKTADHIVRECLNRRLFVTQTQGSSIRIFPALNIKREELDEGLTLFEEAVDDAMRQDG